MMLSYRDIAKTFSDQEVLKGANLDIAKGDRIGIVGRNGAGKTTLANIIYGKLMPDSGAVIKQDAPLVMAYLEQSARFCINTEAGETENVGYIEGNTVFAEVTGIAGSETTLSGGERTRLALAAVISAQPDLLILDEPTNHLDFQGTDTLVIEIARFTGSVVIISHDRYFLDRTVNRIVEIDEGKTRCYLGNYTTYRELKRREYETQLHQFVEEKKRKKKIEEEIERIRQWSAKAHREAGKSTDGAGNKMGAKEFYRLSAKRMDRRVKSKIKRLTRMEEKGIEKPKDDPKLNFIFGDTQKHGRRILEARSVSKAYGKRSLFCDSSFFFQRGDKLGILGPNGCGKTTLVRCILGEEELTAGDLWLSPSAGITYISQDSADNDTSYTPLELVKRMGNIDEGRARTLLACMELDERMIRKPIATLSRGERIRVRIACAILEDRDFLILDEPTNHLDLFSREQLENALMQFGGTLLVVSHDRYLLEKVCSKMLIFTGERIFKFDGGVNECFSRMGDRNVLNYDKEQDRIEQSEKKERLHDGLMRSHSRKSKRNEGLKYESNRITGKEEMLLIENRIAELVSLLSMTNKEDPKYMQLDSEFRELIVKRRR